MAPMLTAAWRRASVFTSIGMTRHFAALDQFGNVANSPGDENRVNIVGVPGVTLSSAVYLNATAGTRLSMNITSTAVNRVDFMFNDVFAVVRAFPLYLRRAYALPLFI